ncbi:MAG TPA: Hsp20/alpha crystallin family protein [Patescibacteria group bacterium]|nr:Hsp20/alpha crystallin family protein [Patescibacteria group bacterium]
MKIIRRDPTWFSPFVTRWPSVFDDEDWHDTSSNLTMYETDDSLVIQANVAGVPAEKVDVAIEGGIITIKADYEENEEEKEKRKVVYREARKAQYLYTANVPCPILADKATAEVKDGVLTLTIAKAEEAKPKRIKVTAEKR